MTSSYDNRMSNDSCEGIKGIEFPSEGGVSPSVNILCCLNVSRTRPSSAPFCFTKLIPLEQKKVCKTILT